MRSSSGRGILGYGLFLLGPVPSQAAEVAALRIAHPVPDYPNWKRAFDSDPAHRERSGVRRFRILRALDDPSFVMIDLEFDTKSEAEALLAAMREIWGRVEGAVMWNLRARIVEVVESKEY